MEDGITENIREVRDADPVRMQRDAVPVSECRNGRQDAWNEDDYRRQEHGGSDENVVLELPTKLTGPLQSGRSEG